ncbi:hypothetical protein LINGRAHAP2_LOCUS26104, partial [Linum grandiflorum]
QSWLTKNTPRFPK